jgi:hypothetical protein
MQKGSVNRFVLLGFFVFTSIINNCFAQTDTVIVDTGSNALITTDSVQTGNKKDSLVPPPIHNPRKAAILSAVLPGAGQFYNEKYWKIPIVLAGIGGMAYLFQNNDIKFRNFRKAYILRVDDDPFTKDQYEGLYSEDNLLLYLEQFRRNRDLCAIGLIAFYVLNIVDANVDAHLYTFDVSDDLSLNIVPDIRLSTYSFSTVGFSLKAKF